MNLDKVNLNADQAALWFLGQAGYIVRSAGVTVVIDAYLTDSVGATAPEFSRVFPSPLRPEELKVDLYLVTHNHQDHLDPETVCRYRHVATTQFIAPRLAARKLVDLGLPPERVVTINAGDEWTWNGLTVKGTFALPTDPTVIDTTGYLLTFSNGRNVYHTSDTGFAPIVLQAAPKSPEVLLVPINGKWGNLGVEQAIELTAAVGPRFVFPNHYDLMALNAENPETFRWLCQHRRLAAECVIPNTKEPFIWNQS